MAKSKAVSTKVKNTALVAGNIPSYLSTGSTKGKESFRQQDLKLPFLRVAQKLSPVVKQGKVKEGEFYNSLTGKVYGKSVKIVPVVFSPKRMHFENYAKGGGILCQSPDAITALAPNGKTDKGKATANCAECVLSQWTEAKGGKKSPPECAEQGAYIVLVPGETAPQILIFQNTSYPAHRSLASMIQQSQVDIYGNQYTLSADTKDNAYLVLRVEADGFADEQTYLAGAAMHDGMKAFFNRRGMQGAEA